MSSSPGVLEDPSYTGVDMHVKSAEAQRVLPLAWCSSSERGMTAQVSSSSIPKKGTPFADPKKKRNFATKWIKEGISFANVVSGEVPNQTPIEDKKEDSLRGFLSQDNNNTSDLTQVLELFHII
ncbi:hypothetical protein TNCV_3806271 [Trichonephila clavipes]|nr:hypothetical protein TNCV_3806271 [Trichonephila clavipes]